MNKVRTALALALCLQPFRVVWLLRKTETTTIDN